MHEPRIHIHPLSNPQGVRVSNPAGGLYLLGPGSHGSDHLLGGVYVEGNAGMLAVVLNTRWGAHASPAMWAGVLGKLLHLSSFIEVALLCFGKVCRGRGFDGGGQKSSGGCDGHVCSRGQIPLRDCHVLVGL